MSRTASEDGPEHEQTGKVHQEYGLGSRTGLDSNQEVGDHEVGLKTEHLWMTV